MRKKIAVISSAAVLGVLFSVGVVLAYLPPGDMKLSPSKTILLPGLLEDKAKARCDKIQGKLDAKVENFNTRKGKHETAYKNLQSRLQTLLEKLNARGYDTMDFQAEIETLGDKIKKFGDDYKNLIDKLEEIRGYACDHTDAEVKIKLVEARALLKAVREDDADIRNYYKTVIKPDLKEIRKQTPAG